MPWPLRLISADDALSDAYRPEVGDCYYADAERFGWVPGRLGLNYQRDWNGKRMPIVVRLPPGFWFWIDSKPSDGGQNGWKVTGSIEDGTLTVSPSINCPPDYHGYIQHGVITDDCEGRQFTPKGHRPPWPE